MNRILPFIFLSLSCSAFAASKEFVIETSLETGSNQVSYYRIRVADGQQTSLSTHSDEPSTQTALKILAEGAGEDAQGVEQVFLRFQIQYSQSGKTIHSSPEIMARVGQSAHVILGSSGQESLRLNVKAIPR